jgi:hypothetical protein
VFTGWIGRAALMVGLAVMIEVAIVVKVIPLALA